MTYPENQRWALALAAVITELDGAHHDALGGWGDNEHTRPWCKDRLAQLYGIGSPEQLRASATHLYQKGQTAEARDALAALPLDPAGDDARRALVRRHRATIARSGLLAWDTARVVAVLGWAVWAGYIAELEAWPVILTGAARIQRAYDSWEAFAEGYELGRLFWSDREEHPPTAKAIEKLLTDAASPWRTLPWTLDLGVTLREPARTRYKRTVCPTCGAPKQRRSATAYVYCDHCGSLSDYDFARACEKPLARPGPVYEGLAAALAPELSEAHERGDRGAYLAAQVRLLEGWVAACPDAVPPRARDVAYRSRYVAYMAEAATLLAFDAEAQRHAAEVAVATSKLSFVQVAEGVVKVAPAPFRAFAEAVFAQQDHAATRFEAEGIYALQPDGAPPDLQRHAAMSAFAQGWLPMLDEAGATELLGRLGLRGEYVEADTPATAEPATCGACGAGLGVFPGAKRMVCEHCGLRVDVEGERARCAGCGASLAPAEGATQFACPHCHVAVQRVAMMTPA